MNKLVRNTVAEFILVDGNNDTIDWSFIEILVEFQENEKRLALWNKNHEKGY